MCTHIVYDIETISSYAQKALIIKNICKKIQFCVADEKYLQLINLASVICKEYFDALNIQRVRAER